MKRNYTIKVHVLILLSLLLIPSCSVLTKTQVKEVSKFASAAKDYSELPGAVIAEHAKIRKTRLILVASTDFNGGTALEAIENALTQNKDLVEKGRQADATLKVLKDYADLLVNLTSDDFTNSLQASSESLGKSIDNGIGQYNKIKGSNLSLFGSGVAAIIRGIGGIYIKAEQEKALKQAITSADPVIKSMTRTVEEIMALYLEEGQLPQAKQQTSENEKASFETAGLLSNEKHDIMNKYKSSAGRYEGKQPPSLPLLVATEMDACDAAASLASKTLAAAGTYRSAHAKLADVVLKNQELTDVIEEVQVLVDEVKAAQELKKKLDNK